MATRTVPHVTTLSPSKRRTGSWLVKFRRAYLAAHPLCERCTPMGRTRLATELDHRRALNNGGKDFDEDPSQAQALCSSCHEAKNIEDMGYAEKVPPDASWGLNV